MDLGLIGLISGRINLGLIGCQKKHMGLNDIGLGLSDNRVKLYGLDPV